MKKRLWKLAKFQMAGALNTGADLLVFFLLHATYVPYAAAQIMAYASGMASSYLLNKYWTFAHRRKAGLREMALFIGVNLCSLGVSLLLLYVFHSLWALPLSVSKMLTTAITLTINFVGYQRLVFR
jgi:putative flippase GtrA